MAGRGGAVTPSKDVHVLLTKMSDQDPYGRQVQVGNRIIEMGGVSLRRPLTKEQWAEARGRLRTPPRPMKVVVELRLEKDAPQEEKDAAPSGPRAGPQMGEAIASNDFLLIASGSMSYGRRRGMRPAPPAATGNLLSI